MITIDQHGLTDQELDHGLVALLSILKTILFGGAAVLLMIPFFNL